MGPRHHRRLINESSVEWQSQSSPSGKFALKFKELSELMLGEQECQQRRPFEVELCRLPPGTANYPMHRHLAAWEYYIILSGEGVLCDDYGEADLSPGDHMIEPPGVAHKLVNTGQEELVYYVIADNPPVDVFQYPDSDKWGVSTGTIFRMTEVDYYEGEDDRESP